MKIHPLRFNYFGPDLVGGVTTAIVSLPLALAFGVASGVGPQAGLYGAVIVGMFAALFGSSSRLISEPTGPMTVIMTSVVSSMIAEYPDQGLAMAFTVVMLAGCFQILMGGLKLGKFITLMPYSVISGFMSGIGILLIVMQIPPFLGVATPGGGTLGVLKALPGMLASVSYPELALGILALAILFGFPVAWRKKCPAQLVALVVATLVSLFFLEGMDVERIGRIPMGLPDFQMPTFTGDMLTHIVLDGLVLGILGSIDTLLTAMIADSLTRDYHDSDRELVGQGIGNLLSGFCGGLPGAGATMGTVVNIQTGAKTNLSGVLRALILLTILLGAAPLTGPIPMAVLAAIALKVGVDILDWSFMQRVPHLSRSSTFMMYVVLFLTVFVDLIMAVGVGVFIANLLTIKRLSDISSNDVRTIGLNEAGVELPEDEQRLMERAGNKVLLFQLNGPMIFGVAKAIAREHAAMQHAQVLVMDLSNVPLLGVTVCLSLENMVKDAVSGGGRVIVAGATGRTRERLEKFGFFIQEGLEERPDRKAALERSVQIIGGE
ncbi:MAG: SulP family inorganic anion transporter [Kiritimatiellae bacterium]|jgi:SulP family sulfate permease|nr:SulP family inorganic anion transporter [Kiritimatiellia bacterium]